MAKRDNNYDWLIKLLIIGDSGVGKTNILLRFCENNFHTNHLTTIGKEKTFLKLLHKNIINIFYI